MILLLSPVDYRGLFIKYALCSRLLLWPVTGARFYKAMHKKVFFEII